MCPHRIFQFKKPSCAMDGGTAQKNLGLDPHKLDGLHADDLVDINAQKLMVFVLQAKTQWPDLPTGRAYGYHIHRTVFLFHRGHLHAFSIL